MMVQTEEQRVDARIVAEESAIPGVAAVLELPVDRLRHKPGTSFRAAVEVDGRWSVVTAYSPQSWRKVGKDVRAARGEHVVDEDRLVLTVPARTDRALPWLREFPGARIVAHNPARRSVLRDDRCVKVHADPHVASRALRAAELLRRRGVATPAVSLSGRHVATCDWIPGAPLSSSDGSAVADLVRRWTPVDPSGLPVLDLHDAVARAVAGTVGLDEEFTRRLVTVARRWFERSGDLRADGFAHGDLSPDQFVVADGELVVLDLDRACRAPRGWDLASWIASTTMTGATSQLSAPPLLVAAAALLRVPEPFRRRRDGWAGQMRALLSLADEVLR